MARRFKIGDKIRKVQAIDDIQWKASAGDTEVFIVSELVGTGFVRLKEIPDFWNESTFDLVESQ